MNFTFYNIYKCYVFTCLTLFFQQNIKITYKTM